MEDDKIIELFFLRSEWAIKELECKYGALCKKIAFHILNDIEDSKECVNDAYFAAWNSIPPQNPKPLITYICRITRNVALKRYHYNTAQKRNSFYDISLAELEECIPVKQENKDLCQEENLTEIIENFLDTLDKKSRIMFVKRYWYAESVKSIAKEFGMTANHVSVKLSRIRNKMKVYLKKEGVVL